MFGYVRLHLATFGYLPLCTFVYLCLHVLTDRSPRLRNTGIFIEHVENCSLSLGLRGSRVCLRPSTPVDRGRQTTETEVHIGLSLPPVYLSLRALVYTVSTGGRNAVISCIHLWGRRALPPAATESFSGLWTPPYKAFSHKFSEGCLGLVCRMR
ncbi:hypothetical protein DFH06DRAFT_508948 [Mycena polygramma]|nr:hypothetical protein DFH06DRAFT_508948 [Mycena polygramma]